MILIINTSSDDKIEIALVKNDGRLISKETISALHRQSERLLPAIIRLLKRNKADLKNLKGIIVVSGPGGFTSLRIGVITANTLSFSLKIPVVGIKLNEFKNFKELVKVGLRKLKKTRIGSVVIPYYGREPHITKQKKNLI